jgi:hypothetical protein
MDLNFGKKSVRRKEWFEKGYFVCLNTCTFEEIRETNAIYNLDSFQSTISITRVQ